MSRSDRIAVIGDLVGSRARQDQAALLEGAARQFERVNRQVGARQPITPTVGDEFQAVYDSVEAALVATLLVRLRLLAKLEIESRFGLGQGTVTTTRAAAPPYGQSGSAWWEAREALRELEEGAGSWPRTARAAYRGERAATVNALLVLRDELVAGMDGRDAEITLGLFAGRRQHELAAALGISQPSVSRRIQRGPQALFQAHRRMIPS